MSANRVDTPWGYYEDIDRTESFVLKKIVVFPGKRTSLQSHENRREIWIVKSGIGHAIIETFEDIGFVGKTAFLKNKVLKSGVVIEVEKNYKHRISNTQNDFLVIYETQFGKCSEDDIVRYEDDFGRS